MEDSLIIKYIRLRKEEGLNLLIDKHGSLIKGVIRKHLSSLRQYESECINDVFLSIWNNISSFSDNSNFKAWICTIAKFKAIDYKRKYLKLNSIDDIDDLILESQDNTEEIILQKELSTEIHSLLNNLSKKDKEIFIKYYVEDKKVKTICAENNLSHHQVYSRLSRGRKKLKTFLNSWQN